MIEKIIKSIKALPINAAIGCVVAVLYFSNNYFFKSHSSGILHILLVGHFNDFLGGLLFVAYTNVFLYTRKLLLNKFWQIITYCFAVGLFWEFVAPYMRADSVSDWWDVLSYVIGGVVYWLLLHCTSSKEINNHKREHTV